MEGVNPYEKLLRLPRSIKKRIRALKKIQLEELGLEVEFYKRINDLEVEFCPHFNSINQKRRDIVCGLVEPSDSDCDEPLVMNVPEEFETMLNTDNVPEPEQPTKGIPGFWYESLKCSANICMMIQERDVPILNHLINIDYQISSSPYLMKIMFEFEKNAFFSNRILENTYVMDMNLDPRDPFFFDGPIVKEMKASKIEWYPGKDVTTTTENEKLSKNNNFKESSFFNFFDPIEDCSDEDEHQDQLETNFGIGQFIRDQIVPRAALYYTGECLKELSDEDEDEDEDEEGMDDDGMDD